MISDRRASASAESWFEERFRAEGVRAQRRYPNEELVRFVAGLPREKKRRVLELGCGSGANLWVLDREGFDALGVDISYSACLATRSLLGSLDSSAAVATADMQNLPFRNRTFDAVLDVFSAYALDEREWRKCLVEIVRVLVPGGLFFSFTPSKSSDAFRNHSPAAKIDSSTLMGIHRSTSPYYGNNYPFRFVDEVSYEKQLLDAGLKLVSKERTTRTYRNGEESFEFLVVNAQLGSGTWE